MSASSSAYVTCVSAGKKYTWRFTGVTSVSHELSLNLETASAQGADIVNGARNRPDRVTLSVTETDAEHGRGRAKSMLAAMEALKRNRILCKVSTSMGTYKKMLLTEISARQDEENQSGWSGSLSFMEYVPAPDGSASSRKTNDNSSTRKNTGTGSAKKLTGTPFQQLLQRAGIK